MYKTVSSSLNLISNTLVPRKQDRSWDNVCDHFLESLVSPLQ